ncbi:MAG: hypothetical protein J6V25_05645 [Oscillospiraceae bacterium]|nr:hypothetical protein [Oscillospiraceae bacterium]
MKNVPVLLSLCLLLCGCAQRQNGILHASSLTPPSQAYPASGTFLEHQEGADFRVYTPGIEDAWGIKALEDSILILSGTEQTTLTLLEGPELRLRASRTLPFSLSPSDNGIHVTDSCITVYHRLSRQLLVFDDSLEEIHVLVLPPGLTGSPFYSPWQNTLYYCTQRAIYAWDLETDLHRPLKELFFQEQQLMGLFEDWSALQCRIVDNGREEQWFLSTQTGQLICTVPGSVSLSGHDGSFYAVVSQDSRTELIFGSSTGPVLSLYPGEAAKETLFLERQHGAVASAVSDEGKGILEIYDLNTGQPRGRLILPSDSTPIAMEDTALGLFFLFPDPQSNAPLLCRWDWTGQPYLENTVYTGPYPTGKKPDSAGLVRCQEYAHSLSQKYGIRILLWKDAVSNQPWDYDLEAEYNTVLLWQALETLDRQLSIYPASIFTDTASHFSSFSVCLVRSIRGSPESGSLDSATGISFVEGSDAYIALALGQSLPSAIHHEFFHMMEVHIWGNSIAFDQWHDINPSGFRYDYDYVSNRTRDSGVYLRHDNRAFVDTYSMSYPKEDRARILEYAILPDQEQLFSSPIMQRKLQLLCSGIREAYRLKDYPEAFLWEQYLQ